MVRTPTAAEDFCSLTIDVNLLTYFEYTKVMKWIATLLLACIISVSATLAQQTEKELVQKIHDKAVTCQTKLPESAMPYQMQACYDKAVEQVLDDASPEIQQQYASENSRKKLILKAMMLEKKEGEH
mgnify:CR=1 FL=1